MSSQSPFSASRAARGGGRFPVLPQGEVVENYSSYAEAQSAVDALARADFPVKQLAIIGNDLKSVELVTGKMSYGRAAIGGAASGAWLGIFLGLILFIFSPSGESTPMIFAALLIGAGFGMLFGLVNYSIKRKRRDFSSVMQVIAVSYTVLAPGELVHRARNLLRGEPAAPAEPVAVPPAPAPTEPPSGTDAGSASTPTQQTPPSA
ncbi:MAG: general stress protein [Microterricola sp.]